MAPERGKSELPSTDKTLPAWAAPCRARHVVLRQVASRAVLRIFPEGPVAAAALQHSFATLMKKQALLQGCRITF